jgi:type I restriction enzyme S subunit
VAEINPSKAEVVGLPLETEVSFVPMEAVGEYGGLHLDVSRSLSAIKDGYTYFRDGDVIVAKITPCFENGKGAIADGLLNGIGFGTTELHVLRPKPGLDSRFLFYVTLSTGFRKQGEAGMYGAGGQKRVSDEFVREFRLPIPPFPQQRAITAFLDRETARIDALIAKKERLLELLEEKRTVLITRAVTKGLDPAVPMKETGAEWLGEVPAHWKVLPIGREIVLQRGVDITKDSQREGPIPVVSSGGVSSFHDRAVSAGPGVVVGRKGTAGAVYYVDTDFWPHDTTLWVKEFRGNHPRFVFYKLSSMNLSSFDTGTANPTLNRNLIHPVVVSWPPIDEQLAIATYLDHQGERTDQLGARIRDAITLLREYRIALISAAVTGQIDVSGDDNASEDIEGLKSPLGRGAS